MNMMPANLMSNLQDVIGKKPGGGDAAAAGSDSSDDESSGKPIVLVTNGNGIGSPGLTSLVEALVREGLYNVHVLAPESDKSVSGHSLTFGETVAVSSADVKGAKVYEVSGTPADCVSIAFSGALFSWSKPVLVISGINKGSSCGHHMFYSGVVGGAREALLSGVPSLSLSLNWKKDESQESDFKDAVTVCLPLINAAMKDIDKGNFPKNCLLDIEIPTSPSKNKGFKVAKLSAWRSSPCWLVSAKKSPGQFMSNQQSLGLQLAQLGRDASAAAARRGGPGGTPTKNVEVESVGASGKSDSNKVKKFLRLEFSDKKHEDADDDLDFRALENGYVAIIPLTVAPNSESDVQKAVSDWVSSALSG